MLWVMRPRDPVLSLPPGSSPASLHGPPAEVLLLGEVVVVVIFVLTVVVVVTVTVVMVVETFEVNQSQTYRPRH